MHAFELQGSFSEPRQTHGVLRSVLNFTIFTTTLLEISFISHHFSQLTMAASYPPLEDRPIKNTICLFDVDGTLTPARQVSPQVLRILLNFKFQHR